MEPVYFFSQENPKGKILILAPEIYPQICVGGLGKFVAGISDGLKQNNWEVAVFTPKNHSPIYLPYYSYQNQVRSNRLIGKILRWCQKNIWFPNWLWVQDWEGVYQAEEWCKLVPNDLPFSPTRIIWTIHSPMSTKEKLGDGYDYSDIDGQDEPIDWGDDFFDFSELIDRGLKSADLVTTVSPVFAQNLSRLSLFAKAEKILGITNGIDEKDWNPCQDGLLEVRMGNDWPEFKKANKQKLQEVFGLPVCRKPIFAFVSRLVPQKGIDLLIQTLPKFLAQNEVQLLIVGRGLKKYHRFFEKLKIQFPRQVGLCLRANFTLPHQVFAGADFLLLPSLGEPFGIAVAEARSYGAVPIVRKTDGLADQVKDGINGLSFEKNKEDCLSAKLYQALKIWQTDWWWQLSRGGKNWAEPWQKVVQKYEPYFLEAN